MKTDDDTVVLLPRLYYWMETKFRSELARQNVAAYFGWKISNTAPIREPSHKW
jgi:hypothetical protein